MIPSVALLIGISEFINATIYGQIFSLVGGFGWIFAVILMDPKARHDLFGARFEPKVRINNKDNAKHTA